MNKNNWLKIILFPGFFIIACTANQTGKASEQAQVTGNIQSGYRIIELNKDRSKKDLTVYRGDYIKIRASEWDTLSIPALKINHAFTDHETYVKMKTVGQYQYSYGDISGTIHVVEYVQKQYHILSTEQAYDMIQSDSILLLDVRTPREYQQAHIENAVLIPVQSLQNRLHELEQYKNTPIVIYCASGNRSTVASKLLIDAGFNHVNNVRYGIKDWIRKNRPVVSDN